MVLHIHIYKFIRIYIYMYIYLYIYTFIRIYIYTYIHLYVYTFIHIYVECINIELYIYIRSETLGKKYLCSSLLVWYDKIYVIYYIFFKSDVKMVLIWLNMKSLNFRNLPQKLPVFADDDVDNLNLPPLRRVIIKTSQ